MRRFEYVGGNSEKFWEVDRDGTAVTVRFGRIGTTGQTQVKDLGTEAAAQAHVVKLVAEKVKKGYLENGSAVRTEGSAAITGAPAVKSRSAAATPPTAAATPPPPAAAPAATTDLATPAMFPDHDEDNLTVPSHWWRQAEPFRGRGPSRATSPDPAAAAVAAIIDTAKTAIAAALAHPESESELAERARLYLGAPGGILRRPRQEVHPLGAAVVAVLLTRTAGRGSQLQAVVDDWAEAYGLVFAAEAGALLNKVQVFHPGRRWNEHAVAFSQPGAPPVHQVEPLLRRLRALLAACDDTTYKAAVERLAEHRSGPLAVRVTTSYLAPTEQEWLDEDIASVRSAGVSEDSYAILLASASAPAQAGAIIDATRPWAVGHRPQLIPTLAAVLGAEAAPIVARLFDAHIDAELDKRLITMLAELPTDGAFRMLLERIDQKYVQPAALEAMAKFPRRAMRLLPVAASGPAGAKTETARSLLRGHAVSHPDLAAAVRPVLEPAPARALDAVLAAAAGLPVAPKDRLPPVLVFPRWADRTPRPKPVVLEGLRPPGTTSPLKVVWKPGEQEEWADTETTYGPAGQWAYLVQRATAGQLAGSLALLAAAPAELVRPHLATFTPTHVWDCQPALRRLLGRFGDEAAGLVFRTALLRPATLAGVLLPVEGADLSSRMADWFATSKTIRPLALAWLERHAKAAARDLVPLALGRPGKERSRAEAALRALDRRGHAAAVRAAAGSHGSAALEAFEATLDVDPLSRLPARIPTLPSWLAPSHLPQVLLADRTAALSPEAVGHLCTMLAMSTPDDTYAGIDMVREAVDPSSLAEMAWGVFERWQGAGYPSKDGWVLHGLGLFGNDDTVRRIAPLIRAWPGEAAHARAVAALDVLSAIGSDVALMHLHSIAEKAKFKGLKSKAQEKMEEVADALGLTADQLADRLVPHFGLDVDGSLVLDYGERRFRVGFDEQLKPVVFDADGSRRKMLPKPGNKDDPTLAPAAYARFSGLKKDIKTVAEDQIRRFEKAMVSGRRWTAGEQRTLFVEHPVLWHLARRLVWAAFGEEGVPTRSFRVAEDRSLADQADEELVLDPGVEVGIAHPLHLGTALSTWSELFADYEILQPFPQLGREVFRLTDAEKAAGELARLAGIRVSTGRILALSHRGWDRGMAEDGGVQPDTSRRVPGGCSVVVEVDPGIVVGEPMSIPEQTIMSVSLRGGPSGGSVAGRAPTFGVLDDITASEVLRDLESLCR